MAVGRISGPLLKSNLLRNGIDLAFETDLLYLDVANQRLGVKTDSPAHELDIAGTARTTDFLSGKINVDDLELDNSTIKTTLGDLTLQGATAFDLVSVPRISIPDVQGNVTVTGSFETTGNIHAQGNITADGNIVLGDENTDNVSFNADIDSDLNPNIDNTYNLGSPTGRWNTSFSVSADIGDVEIFDNIIQPKNDNEDLIIRSNGSGNVVISGLEVDTQGNVNISGDRLRLGNALLDGDGDRTGLFAQDSNTDLFLESSGTGSVLINGIDVLTTQGNAYFVSVNGNDSTNNGESFQDAFRSLEKALSIALSGDTIYVGAGTFVETAPLAVPKGVQIQGSGLRTTQFKPTAATRTENFFEMDGEATVENLTVREIEYDSGNDTGYAFTYKTGALVTRRSAYVKNVTVLNFGSSVRLGTNAADDSYGFDAGDAGRGILVDATKLDSQSLEAAMLFDSVTLIVPNAVGLKLTEGARAEWLNSFTYFADVGITGESGNVGKFGDGKTILEVSGVSGTIQPGDTATFNSTDASTQIVVSVDSVEDNSVLFIDGRIDDFEDFDFTPESITFSPGGATAEAIIRYDRSDFGAELRSIGSANVYGNFGVSANGPGVRLRLSSHDFGYIGSGKKFDNNDQDVVTPNQVIESNQGRVFFTATDQFGDYRIGDSFFVNQTTGEVTFEVGGFDVSSLTGITFTDGSNETIIDPLKVETGNIRISGNNIVSLSGDINIDPFSDNDLNINSDTNITGTLAVSQDIDVTNNLSVTGNTFLTGALDVDSQTTLSSVNVEDLTENRIVLAGIDGELEDSAELTYDGTTFTVDGNSLITGNLDVNGNINLGGNIKIGDQNIDTIEVAADFTSDLIPDSTSRFDLGSVSKTWNTLFSDRIEVNSIVIDDNTISTVDSNANLELRPNGTGLVVIDTDTALLIPVGSTNARPQSETGQIRFNTTKNTFEGFSTTRWVSFQDLQDADEDTSITLESQVGADEDTVFFTLAGTLEATLDSDKLDLKGNDALFSNVYPTFSDLPDPFTYVGLFAYVTATNKAYFARFGEWIEIVGAREDFDIDGNLTANNVKIGGSEAGTILDGSDFNLTTVGSGNVLINGVQVAVFGDNVSEFTNDAEYIKLTDLFAAGDLVYDNTQGVFSVTTYKTADFNSDFSNKTTDELSEGLNNLYFLDSRARNSVSAADNGGDGSFTYDNSTGVFTYTGPSPAESRQHFSAAGDLNYNQSTGVFSVTTYKDADARSALAVSDSGGDGSLTYNNTTGVFTYTGPSPAESRQHFSAAGDLSYDQATGTFSFTERTNAEVRSLVSANDAGGDGSFSYNATTGVFTYTGPSPAESRQHFSAAGDLAYNQTTGEFSVTTYKDPDARAAISVTDAGGDGSLTYDSLTGVITYTGPSPAESRQHFSAGGDLVYNQSTGEFSVTTYKTADFNTDFGAKTTDELSEGTTNLYFLVTRARQSVSAAGDLNYNQSTGVFSVTTYKTADFNTDFQNSSFDDLQDTNFQSKAVDQLIRWSGTEWQNFTLDLDYVSDVDAASAVQNDLLVYNGFGWAPGRTVNLDRITGDLEVLGTVNIVGDLNAGPLNTDDIRIAGNRIETTQSNSDLELGTQGAGVISLLDNSEFAGTVTISDSLSVNGNTTRGDAATDTVNFVADVSSNIIPATATQNIGSAADSWQNVYAGNLQISQNSVTALDTNGNIALAPNGTGYVDIDTNTALLIPTGTTVERPTNIQGMIRFNTDDARFEAYNGIAWTGLGGVIDVDQDTFIIAENSPGADNDQLDFFAGGAQIATIDANGFRFENPSTATISTASNDLILDPAPAGSSGSVIIQGDLTVEGTTTTVNSTVTTLEDPVLTLGGGDAATTNDGKDRGIEFNYFDGTAKLGFFGYDENQAVFKFIPDATNLSEVFSGAVGDVEFANATLSAVTANTLSLATDLEVQHGGTGASAFTLKGILYGNDANAVQVTDAAGTNNASTSNEILTVDGAGTPVWTDTIDEGTF